MKLELNPSKMTVEELTDAINELSTQRARIIEEQRQSVEMAINLQMLEVLHNVDECGYSCTLNVKTKGNRRYRVPLNMQAIDSWQVVVLPKTSEEEED